MKRGIEIPNEILIKRNRALRNQYHSPLLKWYSTNMSYEDKYKFGYLTQDEFVLWQEELAREAEEEKVNHTFWENDTEDRKNMSEDSYENFLNENGVDVRNKNRVDVDAMLKDGQTK